MKLFLKLIFLILQLKLFVTYTEATFGSLNQLSNASGHFNIAHLFPFQGAGPAIGNDAVNGAVNAAIAGLVPGTGIYFAQPLNSAFDGLGSSIASVAEAQAANVALQRLTQQLGGIMGSICPMPTL